MASLAVDSRLLTVLSGCASHPPEPPGMSPPRAAPRSIDRCPRCERSHRLGERHLQRIRGARSHAEPGERVCSRGGHGTGIGVSRGSRGARSRRHCLARDRPARRPRGHPRRIVHEVLKLDSPTGQSYGDRIEHARTEKELSDIFETSPALCRSAAGCSPAGTRSGPADPCRSTWRSRINLLRRTPTLIRSTSASTRSCSRGAGVCISAPPIFWPTPRPTTGTFIGSPTSTRANTRAAMRPSNRRSRLCRPSRLPRTARCCRMTGQQRGRYRARGALPVRAIASGRRRHPRGARGRAQRQVRAKRVYREVFRLAEQRVHHPLPRAAIPQIELEVQNRATTHDGMVRAPVDGRYQACLAR